MNNEPEYRVIGIPITSKEPSNINDWVEVEINNQQYWMPKEIYEHYTKIGLTE